MTLLHCISLAFAFGIVCVLIYTYIFAQAIIHCIMWSGFFVTFYIHSALFMVFRRHFCSDKSYCKDDFNWNSTQKNDNKHFFDVCFMKKNTTRYRVASKNGPFNHLLCNIVYRTLRDGFSGNTYILSLISSLDTHFILSNNCCYSSFYGFLSMPFLFK